MKASMKISPEVLAVIVLFIVVIFIANYGSCRTDPAPFNSKGTFSKMFPYKERFATTPQPTVGKDENKMKINNPVTLQKKEGFETLSPASYKVSSTIDPLGGLTSSTDCIGSSYGYTKSKGGICFDEKTKSLLLTRGGQGMGSPSP